MSAPPRFVVGLVDEDATLRLGLALAKVLRPGDVVLATGELGAGKTTLARGIARGLGAPEEATSPSFALCHLYASRPPLAHVDCWRLGAARELDDLALEELLDDGAIAYIEWGELARSRFGADALFVHLVDEPYGGRAAVFTSSGRAKACLCGLVEAIVCNGLRLRGQSDVSR